uniref:Protein ALP1-like n=1 Tax=Tanacetum cinerariifolium TaxID=118510 RepID=A0A699JVW5_TANCI|nr:hypothetical protein [Tanacetum cinerariifolium]
MDLNTPNTFDHYDIYFQDDAERYMRGFEAYEQFLALSNQEAGVLGSGSAPKKKMTYKPREREEAEQQLIDDNFREDDTPKYTEEANNGLNVLYSSPLFDDVLVDRAPEAPFVVNRRTYNKCYYLADGIYPTWATFVKTYSIVRDEKILKFKRVQESSRKDIERAFGVL